MSLMTELSPVEIVALDLISSVEIPCETRKCDCQLPAEWVVQCRFCPHGGLICDAHREDDRQTARRIKEHGLRIKCEACHHVETDIDDIFTYTRIDQKGRR